MTDDVPQIAMAVACVVIAITWHEAAHGYAALLLGDDTAQKQGRVSLNPLRHVDRIGTVLVPGVLLLAQLLLVGRVVALFGWAKPVPVAAWRFPNPRRGMMLVAAAGPAANFVLAWAAALLLHGLPLLPGAWVEGAGTAIEFLVLANLLLGLFNLLPIPPLDGGRILVGLLPERAALAWARVERAGILVVIFGIFVLPRMLAAFGVPFTPVTDALDTGISWAFDAVRWLSFNDA